MTGCHDAWAMVRHEVSVMIRHESSAMKFANGWVILLIDSSQDKKKTLSTRESPRYYEGLNSTNENGTLWLNL